MFQDKRAEIKEYIDHADERMVDILYAIVATDSEWIIPISDDEKKAIEKGLQDSEAGRTITYDAIKAKYPKWFTR